MKGDKAMKRNLLVLLAVILVASLTLAAGGHTVKLSGTITAIDADAKTITVNAITVKIKSGTTICEGPAPCVPITFADLVVGDQVKVVGVYDGTVLVANKIIVH
jgi:hypothetical protein